MMIKMHNIYIPIFLAIGLVHNSTHGPQLHASTDLEIAEKITACSYLPATIIELATENKSEKQQLQGKIAADALRFAHTALATINNTNDWRTNKYHVVWAAIHGFNLVKNIHKLTSYQAAKAPAPATNKFTTPKIMDHSKIKYAAYAGTRVLLGASKALWAFTTVMGGVRKTDYNSGIFTYSKALSSCLLSLTECLDTGIAESNSFKQKCLMGAFVAHLLMAGKETFDRDDKHETKIRETHKLARPEHERFERERDCLRNLNITPSPRQPTAAQIKFAIRPMPLLTDECSVCLSPYGYNFIRLKPCGHDVCTACKKILNPYICPECREPIAN